MDRRAVAIAAALIVAPFMAIADGLPSRPQAPISAPCCEQAPAVWTGIYVGPHIGGAWANPSWSFPFAETFNTAAGETFSLSSSGAVWGGHIGVNYQMSRFLVGVEVGYAETRLGGAVTRASPGP
jgi:outer membrane immunogenic protein